MIDADVDDADANADADPVPANAHAHARHPLYERQQEQEQPHRRDHHLDTTATPPEPVVDPGLPIPFAVETTLRATATCFAAFTLAVFAPSAIAPPSQQWLIGLFGSVMCLRVPNYGFVVLGMTVLVYTTLMVGLGSATCLLAAITVSNALFVALFGFWSLWISGLRYGAASKLIGIFPSLLVAAVAMIGLGFHRIVRDGFDIVIANQLLDAAAAMSEDQIQAIVIEYPQILQEAIRFVLGLLPIINQTGIDVSIPSGDLKGQLVHLQFSAENDLNITMQGGIWLLKGFWTWSGLDNPLAVFSNFTVTCSWSFLCVFVGALIPPVRTARYSLGRVKLPQALRDAAYFLRRPDDRNVKERLVLAANAMHGATEAVMTAFEPRILDWRGDLPRITWIPLMKLNNTVERLVLKSLVLNVAIPNAIPPKEAITEVYEECAIALLENKPLAEQTVTTKGVLGDELEAQDDSFWYRESTNEIKAATQNYLDALSIHPRHATSMKEGAMAVFANTAPWFATGLALLGRLFVEIPLTSWNCLTGRDRFDHDKAAHHVKFAVGMAILVSASVYWEAYNDFELNSESGDSIVKFANGRSPLPGSYAGWHLIAYSFATMPTTEGTIKKCFLRIVGTLAGAFSAWAAIRITGGNDYGFVAWLTLSGIPAIYLAVDKQDVTKARMGTSPDYGYGGFYFVLTQAVICMEFVGGVGEGDELVVNRIVSNISGIIVACFMALIPPYVMGSSPKWTVLIITEMKSTLKELLCLLLKNGTGDDVAALRGSITGGYLKRSNDLRDDAQYLLNDAKRLAAFPFFRVDPALEEELEMVFISASLLSVLMERISKILVEVSRQDMFAKGTILRKKVESTLIKLDIMDRTSVDVAGADPPNITGTDIEISVNGLSILQETICQHEAKLALVRWGWKTGLYSV